MSCCILQFRSGHLWSKLLPFKSSPIVWHSPIHQDKKRQIASRKSFCIRRFSDQNLQNINLCALIQSKPLLNAMMPARPNLINETKWRYWWHQQGFKQINQLIQSVREGIPTKKLLTFGHCPKVALTHPPPPHRFGQTCDNFCLNRFRNNIQLNTT